MSQNEQSRRPTQRQIASEAGVSLSTVSLALRGDPRVRAEVAERIRSIAERLCYRPDPEMSALAKYRMREVPIIAYPSIALLLVRLRSYNGERHPFTDRIWAGARRKADLLGYRSSFLESSFEPQALRRMNEILHNRGVRGILLHFPLGSYHELPLSWDRFSAVNLITGCPSPFLTTVGINHFHLMRQALEKIVERGYRRPLLILKSSMTTENAEGFEGAFVICAKALLGTRPAPRVYHSSNFEAQDIAKEVNRRGADCVLLPGNELPARGLQALGLQIPGDLGYCDLDLPAVSKISGIDQCREFIGSAARDMLHSQLVGHQFGKLEHPCLLQVEPRWNEGNTL